MGLDKLAKTGWPAHGQKKQPAHGPAGFVLIIAVKIAYAIYGPNLFL